MVRSFSFVIPYYTIPAIFRPSLFREQLYGSLKIKLFIFMWPIK